VVKWDTAEDLYNNNKLPEGDFLFVGKNGQVVIKNTQSLDGSSSGSVEMPTDVELIAYIRDKDKIPEGNKNFNIPNSELLKKAKLEAKVIKIGSDNREAAFQGKTELTYEEWRRSIGIFKFDAFYERNPGIPRNDSAWLAAPVSRWLTKTNK